MYDHRPDVGGSKLEDRDGSAQFLASITCDNKLGGRMASTVITMDSVLSKISRGLPSILISHGSVRVVAWDWCDISERRTVVSVLCLSHSFSTVFFKFVR